MISRIFYLTNFTDCLFDKFHEFLCFVLINFLAQEAFASLYNDEVNDNEKDVTCELQPQTLDFNAEDSD